ncbi:RNA methyltransferase [Pseudonocardia sp. KRD-184]|uniref:RNA methyltransferase n=1 Tax=Pseudonocardia oceani TaxID=2792013 RepID=A0ABS6UI41_9PSEU|nr:RNA methyltransferase [Pseudonocardia oceani]MBW0093755.1 RNA methyltransferase [Pseudonocardia oceani]MBW0100398.1 RNA methyltransferase [Pseudonocardia oceani]MBW0113132.1 RNA methyltransferase [Pseudonocardia oceani]MBW0125919.1 RNA methyltransferase [Pseudonocardia oceani]MBW0131591.1 RNA methyltransferase [Pseudonocardia oceani]
MASTQRSPRVVAARKLLRRAGRDRAGRFLVEGAQAVREALDAGAVHELFVTDAAAARHPELLARTARVTVVDDRAADSLSDTVTPQGLVAVCDLLDVPVAEALRGTPRLVAVCAGIADPGNAGTVIRVADAAGADAVLLAGDTVDPHNGKAVRASTGSVFHLPLARDRDAAAVLDACRDAGLVLLVADGHGELDLHDPAADAVLGGPVAWVFGGEAHGVPAELAERADHRVRVPIHGRAESLNLATAAAICLYASVAARTRRG